MSDHLREELHHILSDYTDVFGPRCAPLVATVKACS